MEEDNGEDEDEEHDEQIGTQQTNLYPLKKRSCVPSSSTSRRSVKPEKMGEIIEVQGGHIVRATGGKDRHSKVCTAKGTRDRRVRLSAPTAIQFYDVQDRLGYDRPSKAVDWLIKKAKPAIDELEKLPPWKPPTLTSSIGVETSIAQVKKQSDNIQSSTSNSVYDFHNQMNTTNNANFLTPFDDSLRSFFPVASSSSSSSLQFQTYSPELLHRTTNQTQDLRLSLQSLQDPILHHQPPPHHRHHHHHHHLSSSAEQSAIFAGPSLSFDTNTSSWPDQNPNEANRIPRLIGFNGFDANVGGYVFNFPGTAQAEPPPQLFNPNQFFTQRGPLQSSNSPPIRAWMDPIIEDHQIPISGDQSGTISGFGFMTDSGFTRFRLPARIQGEQEQDDIADRQLSGSSAHRH